MYLILHTNPTSRTDVKVLLIPLLPPSSLDLAWAQAGTSQPTRDALLLPPGPGAYLFADAR